MFDFDLAIIFGTLFLSFLAALAYSFWYQSLKHKSKIALKPDSGQSLRASELEELINKAVVEATRSLEDRMEGIEMEVRSLRGELREDVRKALPAPNEEPLLSPSGKKAEESMVRR